MLEPAGHQSGGSHTTSASESVSAANSRSGEALMTQPAMSVRLIAGAPVTLTDHARAERPGLDQVQPNVFGDLEPFCVDLAAPINTDRGGSSSVERICHAKGVRPA